MSIRDGYDYACFDELSNRDRESQRFHHMAENSFDKRCGICPPVDTSVEYFDQHFLLGHVSKYRFNKQVGADLQRTFRYDSSDY